MRLTVYHFRCCHEKHNWVVFLLRFLVVCLCYTYLDHHDVRISQSIFWQHVELFTLRCLFVRAVFLIHLVYIKSVYTQPFTTGDTLPCLVLTALARWSLHLVHFSIMMYKKNINHLTRKAILIPFFSLYFICVALPPPLDAPIPFPFTHTFSMISDIYIYKYHTIRWLLYPSWCQQQQQQQTSLISQSQTSLSLFIYHKPYLTEIRMVHD